MTSAALITSRSGRAGGDGKRSPLPLLLDARPPGTQEIAAEQVSEQPAAIVNDGKVSDLSHDRRLQGDRASESPGVFTTFLRDVWS